MSEATGSTAINVEGLYRKFALNFATHRRYGVKETFKNLLGRTGAIGKLQEGEFWALQDINMHVNRGESVGLIGLNGSGKSTLLKVINGLLIPNRGQVTVDGKVDSLIELGTGFHPNLTGRQNIAIKCAFNGFSTEKTKRIFNDVLEFSELQAAIDRPVKNYSSGMYARLGFAASVFCDPEILLIDEILSVGDFRFKQKCQQKLTELKRGCAVVFVSHSMNAVQLFCDRAYILDQGKVVYDGPTKDAIDFYTDFHSKKKKVVVKKKEETTPQQKIEALASTRAFGDRFHNKEKVSKVIASWETEDGTKCDKFDGTQKVFLRVKMRLEEKIDKLIVGVPVWNEAAKRVCSFSSELQQGYIENDGSEWVEVVLEIDNLFNFGNYVAALAIMSGSEFIYREILPPIEISWFNPRVFGDIRVPHKWIVSKSLQD